MSPLPQHPPQSIQLRLHLPRQHLMRHSPRESHLSNRWRLFYLNLSLIFYLLFFLHSPPQRAYAQSKIIRVNIANNVDPNNNGSSWDLAFLHLQDALATANSGDEIWVAKGVYYPDVSTAGGNTNLASASFLL